MDRINAHAKGLRNQQKTKKYILANPNIYGQLEHHRVFITKSSQFGGDMFCVTYGDSGKLNKAGWDIITMPNICRFWLNLPEENPDTPLNWIWLIQVKTNKLPDALYIKALRDFQVPFYVKKQIFIWNDRQKEPDIIDL